MIRWRLGAARVLGWGAVALASAPARAEAPRIIAVDVVSGEGCPEPGAFLAELAQRLPPDVTLGSGAGARRASVRLDRGAHAGFVGDLTWDGQPARTFEAETCETAARAILLSISLSSAEPLPPEATPETPAPRAAPAPTAADPPPAAPTGATAAPTGATAPPSGVRITYGAVGRFFGAASPANVAVGGAIDVALPRDGVLETSMRLTLTRGFTSYPDGGPDARMHATLARFDLCPLRLETGRLSLTPCFALDAGDLSFVAPRIEDRRVWLAADLLARGAVRVVGPLGIELAVGLEVPLLPARFSLLDAPGFPPTDAWTSGDAGFLLETGLMLTFP